MKTQSTSVKNTFQYVCCVLVTLISLNGFSQASSDMPKSPLRKNKTHLTSLQDVVEGIKQKNESIKNAECVNVMVNDMLIKDIQDFTIDPKSIAMVEVLVLEPKAGGERINPSIIINTK